MSDLLHKYGARIKSIYLELIDYSFYHNPSEIRNPDKRFIGRKEMRKKLKNLITKSETNSGTYLVTGFRGMGKTSFVNQVLSEIRDTTIVNKFWKLLFGYSLMIWIASFFNVSYVLAFSIVALYLFLNVIVSGDDYYINYRKTKKFDLFIFLKTLFNKFLTIIKTPFEKDELVNNKKLVIAKKAIRILSIILVASIFLIILKHNNQHYNYKIKLYVYLFFLVLYLLFVTPIIHTIKYRKFKAKDDEKRKPDNLKEVVVFLLFSLLTFLTFKYLLEWNKVYLLIIFSALIFWFRQDIKKLVHSFLNNNEIIPIRINLGKERLSEEDILRLIAYALVGKYKSIANHFGYFKRALWTLSTGLLIYLIALAFYFNNTTYKFINKWKQEVGIIEYFPSQAIPIIQPTSMISSYFGAFDSIKLNKKDNIFKSYANSFNNNYDLDSISISKKITFTIDYLYLSTFFNFTRPLFDTYGSIFTTNNGNNNNKNHILSKTLDLNTRSFHLFPFYDYFFIIFIFLFSLLGRRILRWRIWGVNHSYIYNSLNNLIESIDAKIYEENKGEINLGRENYGFFKFFKSKNKEYPIAGAREIEMSLIAILADIESIPAWRLRPRLVFIFDELDKIQPRENLEADLNNAKEYAETEWVKRRQDTIRKILTNLKHFFNTAKAKFVFIAGREMYDAALADISDRDALIGSMFHDILYVHSFYKDPADERLSDITSMTERYISQFLIPERYAIEQINKDKKFDFNLFWYGKYLEYSFPKLEVKEKIKIIITLHDFISYISYRSNGAPKKITRLFDEHIVSFPVEKDDFNSTIITLGDKRNLYLHFNYNDQYIFTVGKYLFNPFVIAVNKYISHFEDKLLVSTSFLLNHLYKFHKVGFSYKTLELTPEIIAIYKAPELRDFIMRLIQFMNKTHIRKIISGLYDFKFHSKLEKEIAFVSKISEKESAALNFTLDESLIIKSIFRSQLRKLKSYWKGKKEIKYNIESLTVLYANLGDLNFNDNQFFEAIHYYKEALIPYKNNSENIISPDTMIIYIRIYLKLGLAFEMVRNMSKALLIYETIYSDSVKYVKKCLKNKNWNKYSVPKENPPLLTIQRLFYQALIAKLQIIEKSTIKSLTKNQVNSNINDFNTVINMYLEPEQKFLLKSEYNNKLGDLLFYKNGIVFGKAEDEKAFVGFNPEDNKNLLSELIHIQKIKKDKEHLYALPISGYKHYMISLANLVNIGIEEKFNSRITYFDIKKPEESEKLILHYFTDFLFRGAQKDFPITRRSFYLASANALSDAGDTILIISSADFKNKKTNGNMEVYKDTLSFEILGRVFKFNLSDKNDSPHYSYKDNNPWHIEQIYDSIKKNDKKGKFVKAKEVKKLIDEINEFGPNFSYSIRTKSSRNIYEIIGKLKKELSKISQDSQEKWSIICDIWNNIDEIRNELIDEYKEYTKEKLNEIKILETKNDYKRINEIKSEINRTKKIFHYFNEVNRIFGNDRIEKVSKKINNDLYKPFNRFHIALRYYVISAGYFLKSEDYKEYVFQMTKVLHIFRVFFQEIKINKKGKEEKEKILDLIKKSVVEKAIRYNFKAYKNYNTAEEQKFRTTDP